LSKLPYEQHDKDLYLKALTKADNKYLQFSLLRQFVGYESDIPENILTTILDEKKNWSAVSMALALLSNKNAAKTKEYIVKLKDVKDQDVVYLIASSIVAEKSYDLLPYTINQLGSQPYYAMPAYGDLLNSLFAQASAEELKSGLLLVNSNFLKSNSVSVEHKRGIATKLQELNELIPEDNKMIYQEVIRGVNLYQYLE